MFLFWIFLECNLELCIQHRRLLPHNGQHGEEFPYWLVNSRHEVANNEAIVLWRE
jgi:hypothetical protein